MMRYIMEKCVLMGGILWWQLWQGVVSEGTFLWVLLWFVLSFLGDWVSHPYWKVGIAILLGGLIIGQSLTVLLPIFIMQLVCYYGVIGIVGMGWLIVQPDLLSLILCIIAAYVSYRTQQEAQRQTQQESVQDALQQEAFELYNRQQLQKLEHEKHLELAKLNERNRISHELHDEIGHTISTTIMTLEALQLIIDQPTIVSQLDQLSRHLQEGMDRIRHTLHGMYDDTFQLEEKLQSLISPISEHAQVDYQYHITTALPLPMRMDILAIAKELTTNFIKHSMTRSMHLYLIEHPHILTIDYLDETPIVSTPTTSGIGLVAMNDIIQKYHGELTIDTKQGYHVFIRIPKTKETPHD